MHGIQLDILSYTPPELHGPRDGETYDEKRDRKRLDTLQDRVYTVMLDGGWHTLKELAENCGGSEASVSARIRDLRKIGLTVDRQNLGGGLWQYRMRAGA